MIRVRALSLVLAAAALASPPLSSQSSPFPEGKGREAVLKVCGGCHGPESVAAQLKTRDEWSKTIDEMANYGAQGTDEEFTAILEYVVKNFSLIQINKATARELESTLDVPEAASAAIVQYREAHGRVASMDELKKIEGVDAAKVDARKDRLIF